MKTVFYAWVVFGVMGAVPVLQAQSTVPKPLEIRPLLEGHVSNNARDDEARALEDLATIAHARASDAASMEHIIFSEESVTVSEPSNRMLFEHEQNVNSFLSIGAKLGMGRLLIVHMSHPRLATHGGVTNRPMGAYDGWNENGHRYALARPWGMIGDLDQPKPKAYLFRPSPFLRQDGKNTAAAKAEPKVAESALNRFEDHALALLRKGEKLVRWEHKEAMHAVGAIRAETQCLRCHEGSKAGDLLGAFTYSFVKSKAAPPDEQTKLMLKLSDEGQTLAQIAEAAGLLKGMKGGLNQRNVAIASYNIQNVLLEQGVVTAEMIAEQARYRKQLLETDLGPDKKPGAAAGAE